MLAKTVLTKKEPGITIAEMNSYIEAKSKIPFFPEVAIFGEITSERVLKKLRIDKTTK